MAAGPLEVDELDNDVNEREEDDELEELIDEMSEVDVVEEVDIPRLELELDVKVVDLGDDKEKVVDVAGMELRLLAIPLLLDDFDAVALGST